MAFSVTVAARGVGSPWETILAVASLQTGVSVALLKGIISQESAWSPQAVNPSDPSYGLCQINLRAHPEVSAAQALDPSFAIPWAARYLASLIARDGLPAAISSYNAGRPISGNAAYVDAVLAYQAWFEQNDPASGAAPGGWTDPGTMQAVYTAPPDDAIAQLDSDGNVVGWYVVNADGTSTTWDAWGENGMTTAPGSVTGLSLSTWALVGGLVLLVGILR